MHYSIEPKDQIFVKDYGFLSFAKNMNKSIATTIGKNFSGIYSQKLLDYAKQLTTDALKTTSKRVIQKKAEATGDLIGNKTAYKITKFSKTSPRNSSETVESETKKYRIW